MAVRRRSKSYSKLKPINYTRFSKKQKKNYIKAVPSQKIVKFNMGDANGFKEGKYKIVAVLSSEIDVQIRDMALEAVRQSLNKDVTKLFQKNFFLQCNVFPHNILRNNRVYSGASKGDRVQSGMSQSFGKPEGRAATVKRGKSIFTVHFNGEPNIVKVKEFFRKAAPKLPCKTKLTVICK